ncbi:MAG TPA: molybdenum cofactor biosynthesis protein MoaE [Terriglobales bacterium]|jgi:molybdopterin synthase catalytic subunit|nr:molybdenum cofactor biosynthesis protein MoaE [Terriglobales bacterium]
MQVRVLFFGILKDLAGRSADLLSLPDNASAADVLSHYQQRLSANKAIFNSVAVSVNQEYAQPEMKLHSGDEVALLPPVSGGANETDQSKAERRVSITRQPINTAALLENMKHPDDGAAIVFEGIVRDNTRGRRTLFLDYEAYEEMAVKEMESLVTRALDQFQIRDAAIIHRLGRIEIGETSVLIIVASAHRAAAFDACRWLIDTLKRTVPIWKKEYFDDGAFWSDGEPFPEHVTSSLMEARAPSPVHSREATPKGSQTKNSASNPIAHK